MRNFLIKTAKNCNQTYLLLSTSQNYFSFVSFAKAVNRKLERLVTNARFRYRASFEEIDISAKRNLDKNQLFENIDRLWCKNSIPGPPKTR